MITVKFKNDNEERGFSNAVSWNNDYEGFIALENKDEEDIALISADEVLYLEVR